MIVVETRPPVRRPQEGLQGAGQVHKHVAHQKEPTRRKQRLQTLQKVKERQQSASQIKNTFSLYLDTLLAYMLLITK